jgi:phospholipase C
MNQIRIACTAPSVHPPVTGDGQYILDQGWRRSSVASGRGGGFLVIDDTHISRRSLLAAGAWLGTSTVAVSAAAQGRAAAAPALTPSSLADIEHVVILMQENRSFDHYFGTLSGVRGFADPTAAIGGDGLPVFYQPDVDLLENPARRPYVLPWHLDSKTTSAQNAQDLSHAWSVQHLSWNEGLMDGFVTAHRLADDVIDRLPGAIPVTNYGPLTMGYFTRADIPFHYELADAFTICDNYHCSVFGPTNPNRIMHMSGTIDPQGTLGGGPCIDNSQVNGQLRWESYPERLQRAGIDWYLYQETDNFTDNMLPFFAGFNDTRTDLYRRGNSFIPTPSGQPYGPALAAQLRQDVVSGNLPQVSWIVGSYLNSEHPEAAPSYGAHFTAQVIDALMADPAVWAKTVLILNFDENDGFFDHVVPPTPPEGTPGEYLTVAGDAKEVVNTFGYPGPVGLGFRVPMMVISPFSRGGLCCSEVFDHTSVLFFLERRFGVEVPYVSQWRRETVGDLAGAFNFAAVPDLTVPPMTNTSLLSLAATWEADHLPAPLMPKIQTMPGQEAGPPRPRPSGPV